MNMRGFLSYCWLMLAVLVWGGVSTNLAAAESAPDLVFYIDSEQSLEREIDYSRMLDTAITVEFRLLYTVGLRSARDFLLEGQVKQTVLSPESFEASTGLPASPLLEASNLGSQLGFEFGVLALLCVETGDMIISSYFTSELPAQLNNEDAELAFAEMIRGIPSTQGHQATYHLLYAHTHPSLFPLGTSDRKAAQSFLRWLGRSHPHIKIQKLQSVAISQSETEPSFYIFSQTLQASDSSAILLPRYGLGPE